MTYGKGLDIARGYNVYSLNCIFDKIVGFENFVKQFFPVLRQKKRFAEEKPYKILCGISNTCVTFAHK